MDNSKSIWAWGAIFVASLGYFADAFDIFLVPAMRVRVLQDLGVSAADSLQIGTVVFNWQLFGMLIGAFICGLLADRFGRKKILLGSILLYSLASITASLVMNVSQYSFIRFVAGLGLGGQLGAGVTLVMEKLSQQNRSIGTMIIGFFGMMGVVAASLLSSSSLPWRTNFVIGGILGFVILALRVSVQESQIFVKGKPESRKTIDALRTLFLDLGRLKKYILCVLVGTPTYFVIGILVSGAPEFGKSFGLAVIPSPSVALIWTYLSVALGDIICGLTSQILQSRLKSLFIFQLITAFAIASIYFVPPTSDQDFYIRCAIGGFGAGYWANLVANAAEQFGTDVRATVAITVPNLVRFLLFPISFVLFNLKQHIPFVTAATIVGLTCSVIAIGAILLLEDRFKTNLDYQERTSLR